jgi:anti-sigma B factor antagonist
MFIAEEDIVVRGGTNGDITVTLLHLHGTLELSTVLDFKERLTSLLTQGHKHLILNLSQLSFIDSSGLTALVVSARDLSQRGGVMVIAELSEAITYTFEIAMMQDILTIYLTQEEAIQHFSPGHDSG